MKKQMLCIRDIVADQYMPVTFVPSIGVALRSLSDDLGPGGQAPDVMKHHSRDYEIFHFGEWDDETGKFDLFERPVSLGLVAALMPAQELKAVN